MSTDDVVVDKESIESKLAGAWNKPLRILYLGYHWSGLHDRYNGLRRLGHEVVMVEEDAWYLTKHRSYQEWWTWHAGSYGIRSLIERQILKRIPDGAFDVAWVDTHPMIGEKVLKQLKKQCKYVLHYNQDDPFGGRDGRRWDWFVNTIPLYDLLVVMREPNIAEAKSHGASRVLRVNFAADEKLHARRVITEEIREKWQSEVLFLGTWFPERGPLFVDLVNHGVPLTIRGNRWQLAPEWPQLKKFWKGAGVLGDEYAYAIQTAKICIGIMSKGNRDLHTSRSVEIPYLGSVLCGNRTTEQLALYEDGVEAIFWDDARECAERIEHLLKDESLREGIARRGYERVMNTGTLNQRNARRILTTLIAGNDPLQRG